MNKRSTRVRPQLDDKILLSWNALAVGSYCRMFAALGDEAFLERAVKTMEFLLKQFRAGHMFCHTYKNGEARQPAFLDDYAYLIQSLILLQEVSSDAGYLQTARELTELVIREFGEEETGFFFYTHANQQDVILRKKEIYDGAVPSGNAVMALNLYQLAIIFDNRSWEERAMTMMSAMQQTVTRHPGSFGIWASFGQSLAHGIPEIALVGENFKKRQSEFLRTFIPLKIFQSATHPNEQFPLLAGKPHTPVPQFYLCKQYSCQNPVTETSGLIRLLEAV
ncbi:MAG: thioredoxin domain-containing protein [Chitinophagaceae bacterium]|nr:thioredoxin domain-containing protein [Chitinophagaceae bacterium]